MTIFHLFSLYINANGQLKTPDLYFPSAAVASIAMNPSGRTAEPAARLVMLEVTTASVLVLYKSRGGKGKTTIYYFPLSYSSFPNPSCPARRLYFFHPFMHAYTNNPNSQQ